MKWLYCAVLVLSVATSSAEVPWYKTALIYQIYTPSFKDSDGDGFGDLKGIAESCGYLEDIGVEAVWLTPFYKSPLTDFGYDITNHTEVGDQFGTMADFDELRERLTNQGIKLLIDFDPNHTSDLHPWFLSSRDPTHPQHDIYRDFYVWRDPRSWQNETTPDPPNNWMSVFGGSAWRWGEERRQFYLHQCRHHQPDLNYRNPGVLSNMTAVLEFWLQKGVDGFRVGAMKHLFEDESFPDEPPVPGTAGDTYKTLRHLYSINQPESFQLMKYWANLTNIWDQRDGKERVLFFEVYGEMNQVMKFYGSTMTAPLNPNLLTLTQNSSSTSYKTLIDSWMTHMPSNATANWVIGNHDYPRVSGRLSPEAVDAMNLLTGVLPGVKVVYYGEEIGMQDINVREDQDKDQSIFNRDGERSPMQWNDSYNAGFSTNSTTWLPVNPNYWWLNVAAQQTAQNSHLKVFQEMTKARKDPVLQRGDLQILAPDNDTLIVVRELNKTFFILVINIGSEDRSYTSMNLFQPINLDFNMSIVTGSGSFQQNVRFANLDEKSISLVLRPKEAVLLTSPPASVSSKICQPLYFTASMITLFILL